MEENFWKNKNINKYIILYKKLSENFFWKNIYFSIEHIKLFLISVFECIYKCYLRLEPDANSLKQC